MKIKNTIQVALISSALALILASCTTFSGPSPKNDSEKKSVSSNRTLELNGTSYSEKELGPFESWTCHQFFSDVVLIEFGRFGDTNLTEKGFVLYDGTDSGELTSYKREGIDRRWDWGPNGNDFAFVIKPNGAGYFYNFTKLSLFKRTTQASGTYNCIRR